MIRVLIIGSNNVTQKAILELLKIKDLNLVGVLTAESRFKISYSVQPVVNVNYTDLEATCSMLGIPCHVMRTTMKDQLIVKFIEEVKPSLIVVVGWHHMIPGWVLSQYNTVGVHASVLPKYRGGAPLVWALINGESETGVTLFQLDSSVDGGPILGIQRFPISEQDQISDLLHKAEIAAIALLSDYAGKLVSQDPPSPQQQELRNTQVWPQRSPADGNIDANDAWDCKSLRNFIRAQSTPYPGAFTRLGDSWYTLWTASSKVESRMTCQRGLHNCENETHFGCKDGCLLITSMAVRQP